MSLYSRMDRLAADVEKLDRQVKSVSNAPQSQRTSVEGGSIDFNDSDGNLRAIVGEQDDGGNTINVVTGPTPPTPTNYTVTVDHGSLTVHWDGEFEDDAVAPTDWARWTAYAQPGEFVVPERSTAIGGTDSASGGEVTAGVLKGQWTVTVLAWSQAGKPSVMGDPVTVVVPGYGEIVLEEIDAADTIIKNGSDILVSAQDTLGGKLDSAFVRIGDAEDEANTARTAADEAKSAAAEAKSDAADAAGIAGGKADVLIQSSTPASSLRKPTTLWIDTTGGANTPKRWDGSGWVAVTDQAAVDAANLAAAAKSVADDAKAAADQAILDAALANDNANAALVSANGKNTVFYDSVPPTSADEGIAGDSWFVGEVGRPDDVVQATNLAPNPSFEIDTSAWEIRWAGGIEYIDRYDNVYLGVSVGDYCLGIKGTDTVESGTGLIQTAPIAVSPGEWVNVAGSFRAQGSTPVAVRLRLYWLDPGGNEIGSSYLEPWRVASDLENSVPANRIVGSAPGQAPSGAVAFRLAVWFRDVNGSDAPPAGFVAYIDGVQVASASSEAGAKSAVATYFDGDTTDGATDDDPHYRWTGTPHASPSEKYLPATEGLSDNWNVVAQYRHDGTGWVEVELSHHVISSADVGKLVAGSATIKEAVVQKLFAEVVVARMSIADEFIGSNAILDESVTAPKIVASEELWAKLGQFVNVRAEMIDSDAFNGRVFTGNTYLTSDGNGEFADRGLFFQKPDGTALMRVPTDGSPMSFTASDTQIQRAQVDELEIVDGGVRSGGVLALSSGVTPPAPPPELNSAWRRIASLARPEPGTSFEWVGLATWGDKWVRGVNVLGAAGDSLDAIAIYNPDGSLDRSFHIDINPQQDIAVIGDVVYVLGRDHLASNAKDWVHGFDLNTGSRTSRHEYTRAIQAKNALGSDGTNLIVAGVYNRELYVHRRNPVTGVQVGPDMRSGSDTWPAPSGSGLFGVSIIGSEVTVVPTNTSRVYGISGGTLVRKTEPSNGNGFAGWPNPDDPAGFAWVDGLPCVVDGSGVIFEGSTFASTGTFEACFTWWDGAHETTPSPAAVGSVYARHSVTLSMPKRAGLQKRLYVRTGATGGWNRQTVGVDATSLAISGFGSGLGTLHPLPATNSFPNADPAALKSANDKFVVKGDGSGHWGPLTFNADGTMTSAQIPAWIPLTTFASGFGPQTWGDVAAYRVWPDGKVEWRGVIAGNISGTTTIATIPTVALPAQAQQFAAATGNPGGDRSMLSRLGFETGSSTIVAFPNGVTVDWISLAGIYYYLT